MLDVRRLRLLRELAHLGTIAAVAEALSFSPSAVSQQLSVLEKEAGVALLERTGRRVALTPAGRNLVRHAEAVLERLEQADAELAHAREGLAGPLRIGTYPSAARAIFPAVLAELAGWHPGLEPMITEVDPAEVAAALRAGELDVALVHEYDLVPADPEPGLAVTRPIFTEPMYLAARAPGAVADQRAEPWILAPPGTLCHSMAVRACEAAGFAPRIRHQIDDFATVLALVAAGQGVALVPHLGIDRPPPGVVLTRLPMYRRTRTAFRAGAGAHPAISAFVSALHTAVPAPLRNSA
ncbi:LysR substrate-binding domain-containing protein [Kitasatospora sp. NPDC008115]|uniref:LysR family transcriptional regulator n=1 Tax=Kitasatospora sp. NPDC008115 TaxID=3364022 RepID=UPI0036E8507A